MPASGPSKASEGAAIGLKLIGKHVRRTTNQGEPDECIENGVIVNAWYEPAIGSIDCYVALYDSPLDIGSPAEKPFIYRYAVASLELIEP